MTMLLTDQQREQVGSCTDEEPVEVVDQTTRKHYRLVPAEFYEQLMAEWRRDEEEQAAWSATSMQTLAQQWADEE